MKTIRATLNGQAIKAEIGPGGIVIKRGKHVLKAPPPETLALSPVQRAARHHEAICGQIMEIYRQHGWEWLWTINPMDKYTIKQLMHHLARIQSGRYPWKI